MPDDHPPSPAAGAGEPGRAPASVACRSGPRGPPRTRGRDRGRAGGRPGGGRGGAGGVHGARPAARRHGHRTRCRAAGRRPGLPAGPRGAGRGSRRRRRARGPGGGAAGVGNPALRAGQPRARDDGPAPRRVARCHRRARRGLPAPPRVVVAPIRALLQRLAPADGATPLVVRPGEQVDVDALLHQLVDRGYRREHQVEHRGEFAVRGGIVDVFPSTADVPVRIDLWGDEVDRLTAFAVSDQRSSRRHLLRRALYGCRELTPTAEVRSAAPALMASRPWGTSVWERLARGDQFDGMESWLPFLDAGERVLPDLLPSGAQVVLIEPRRDEGPGGAAARRGGGAGRHPGGHVGRAGRRRGPLPAPARPLRAVAARHLGRSRGHAHRPRGTLDRGAHGRPVRAGGGRPGATGRRGDPAGRPGLFRVAVRGNAGRRGAAVERRWPKRACTRRWWTRRRAGPEPSSWRRRS